MLLPKQVTRGHVRPGDYRAFPGTEL